MSGWSYGGFMTSYALTHSTTFAMGIAGGSVTDWRNYDSIYTERYMLVPAHNADGYARTAPRLSASHLSGRLLLLHGTMDDNVHLQNTLQLAYELQRAEKPFEMMLYPKSRHGVSGSAAREAHARGDARLHPADAHPTGRGRGLGGHAVTIHPDPQRPFSTRWRQARASSRLNSVRRARSSRSPRAWTRGSTRTMPCTA